jgi:hypothetical protein
LICSLGRLPCSLGRLLLSLGWVLGHQEGRFLFNLFHTVTNQLGLAKMPVYRPRPE